MCAPGRAALLGSPQQLMMMGGALGGLEAMFLPNEGLGFWPLVSMSAVLGGTMRSPFTGIIFVLELTHDLNVLLPLVLAVTIAHGFTVLTMRRSILTEKVSRRGYHLSREYAVDPLEVLFVREVMRTKIAALPASTLLRDLSGAISSTHRSNQRLYPVVDHADRLVGVVTASDVKKYAEEQALKSTRARLAEVVRPDPVLAYPDEPLTAVVNRMAESGLSGFPVVEPGNPQRLLGLISLRDLLKARVRRLEEEHRRERVLPIRLVFPWGRVVRRTSSTDEEVKQQEGKESGANWRRVRNPDCWNGVNRGFNQSNAEMVCQKCHQEFPYDLKCETCGSSKLVLDTAMATPGIFCSVCHQGQWHWDCPNCGRRQDFAACFFYNERAIVVSSRLAA
jgi:CBS domain-containing protein